MLMLYICTCDWFIHSALNPSNILYHFVSSTFSHSTNSQNLQIFFSSCNGTSINNFLHCTRASRYCSIGCTEISGCYSLVFVVKPLDIHHFHYWAFQVFLIIYLKWKLQKFLTSCSGPWIKSFPVAFEPHEFLFYLHLNLRYS